MKVETRWTEAEVRGSRDCSRLRLLDVFILHQQQTSPCSALSLRACNQNFKFLNDFRAGSHAAPIYDMTLRNLDTRSWRPLEGQVVLNWAFVRVALSEH